MAQIVTSLRVRLNPHYPPCIHSSRYSTKNKAEPNQIAIALSWAKRGNFCKFCTNYHSSPTVDSNLLRVHIIPPHDYSTPFPQTAIYQEPPIQLLKRSDYRLQPELIRPFHSFFPVSVPQTAVWIRSLSLYLRVRISPHGHNLNYKSSGTLPPFSIVLILVCLTMHERQTCDNVYPPSCATGATLTTLLWRVSSSPILMICNYVSYRLCDRMAL